MQIDAKNYAPTAYREMNEAIRESADREITVMNALGHRYIGCALKDKKIDVYGTPGNGLGDYLGGAVLRIHGNAQDETGDTMDNGEIIIHGSSGDATGYAMRGGAILIRDNVGYRAGIHMKAYQEKQPVLIVGGKAGSFLGEYQAGGIIAVLGLGAHGETPVGYFCGVGMHGGKMFLRCDTLPEDLPMQICCKDAKQEDLKELLPWVKRYCAEFGTDEKEIMDAHFFVLTPNTAAPYKRLYTAV